MKRRYLAQALLVASLGAFAAAGYAQTNSTNDQTPGSPGAATPAAGAGTTAGTTGTTTNTMGAGAYGTTPGGTTTNTMGAGAYGTAPAGTRSISLERLRAYEHARANCEAGPAAQRAECQSALTKEYTGIPGPCQKLTGNALDACVHGDYPANAGMPAKTTK